MGIIFLRDLILSIALISLSIFLFIESNTYPQASAFYPQVVLSILLILSLIMLIRTVVKRKKIGDLETSPTSILPKNVFWISLMTALYVFLLLPMVGYYPSTLFYILGTFFYLKISKKMMILTLLIYFLFVYGFFELWLDVRMP